MKRIALLPITIVAGVRVPTLPAGATGWVMLHDFGARALVKVNIADGTVKTATTLADVTTEADENGSQRQVGVYAETLTATQRTTLKTMLSSAGFDVSSFDADDIQDRARLLRFVLRRLANWPGALWALPVRDLLEGWDAG